MKQLIIILALLWGSNIHAQLSTGGQTGNSSYNSKESSKGCSKGLKSTGKILTFIGAPVFVVGSVCYVAGISSYDYSVMGLGYLGMIAGAGMTGAGIPLWIIGSKKYKRCNGTASFDGTKVTFALAF
jgi:hypothetical protein